MNYATIKPYDIANGPGVRVSLFVSGCRHHCRGCFNPETWNFNYGNVFNDVVINKVVEAGGHDYISGLSVLGGEPFEPENLPGVLKTIEMFKAKYPEKDVWVYSGYMLEELQAGTRTTHEGKRTLSEEDKDLTRQILSKINVLVDGEFHIEEKDLKLRFRGSSNQRVIDVPATLQSNEIILWEEI